ncbi:hypothetical protein P280DRAFT_468279 [Massarina eburnea CBS 473.64]|uniref:Uncharacterized protein n=1 Tax=Massarina eburnea CBS 473.64 TaxID=1395130 RepID=A0A6A6S349_9PLEO|nr:hypothetical protein P280DRAFT_468279 [Massarina eburnea CBS 473.64]
MTMTQFSRERQQKQKDKKHYIPRAENLMCVFCRRDKQACTINETSTKRDCPEQKCDWCVRWNFDCSDGYNSKTVPKCLLCQERKKKVCRINGRLIVDN